MGQSNAGTPALTSGLADPSLALPYPNVPYIARTGNDLTPPVLVDYPVGDLGPRGDVNGVSKFGIELTLGRGLDAFLPNGWALAKFAYASTALAGEWSPTSIFPTSDPTNLYTQCIAYIAAAEAATHSQLAAIVWIQGESDSGSISVAKEYGIRLAEFIGAMRFSAAPVPFIYGKLNVNCFGLGVPTTRAGQVAAQLSAENVLMVDMDAFGLQGDATHYTAASLVSLGSLYAQEITRTFFDKTATPVSIFRNFNRR